MSAPKHIWLVRGFTGEYSDATQWIVGGYTSESEAQKHAEAARIVTAESASWEYERRTSFKNPHDSQCQIDYNGVEYSVEMVEILEAFSG